MRTKALPAIALVGATGAVGTTALQLLAEGALEFGQLHLVASARSAGRTITHKGEDYQVENLEDFDFRKVQIAIFSAGGVTSANYAPKAAQAGCVVIDNTSHFRYDDQVPLVVSEVNPQRIRDWRATGIIANPNCSTMQILVALKPIYDLVGIERYTAATYQAVSGAGARALSTLAAQNRDLVERRPTYDLTPFTQVMAGNVIPHIDTFLDNAYTKEEMKTLWESRKILEDDNLKVSATCVRVPVACGHSVALHVETRERFDVAQIQKLLARSPGITLIDNADQNQPEYPTPRVHATDSNQVYVGRVRKDISHPRGLALWVVADNLRKGAALNTLQIAKLLIDGNEV